MNNVASDLRYVRRDKDDNRTFDRYFSPEAFDYIDTIRGLYERPHPQDKQGELQSVLHGVGRCAYGITPVTYHKMPTWLKKAIEACGRRLDDYSEATALEHLLRAGQDGTFDSCSVLDHWGTTTLNGDYADLFDPEAFVNEPYRHPTSDYIARWERTAELLGCRFTSSPLSWWYPGRAWRYILHRGISKDGSPYIYPSRA